MSKDRKPPRVSDDWRRFLLRKIDSDGKVKHGLRPVVANVVTVLAHDPAWSGVLAYDDFAETIVTVAPPPWRPQDRETECKPGDWTDEDTTRVQCWLSDAYGIDCGLEAVLAGVKLASVRKRIHPARDWADSLRWDAQRRLPTWLIDVFGCDDTPYVRAIGVAWAVSAVARLYSPGCKVDTVLVLEGDPGIHKSSVLRTLVGDPWFLEMSISEVANKDAMQVLKRKWIAEFPEIDGLSRTEQAHVKAFFSRQVDTYRPSYGKGSRDFPRQTVFAATTNKREYIVDETGGTGRRMWPVWCREGDVARAKDLREQFWAEAVARYQGGEEWHMRDPSLRDAEREEQDKRFRSHPWEQPIARWLVKPVEVPLGGSRAKEGVTTSDVLTGIGVPVERQTHADAGHVGAILRRLGWVPGHPESINGVRVRKYRPADGAGTNGHTLLPLEPTTGVRQLEPDAPELPSQDDLFPPDAAFEAE